VALVAVAVPFCTRAEPEWERVFVGAAQRLRHGDDIYRAADGYLYPPFMAFATLPFAALPASAALGCWLAVNLACVALLLRWAWRAAGGGRLQGVFAPQAEHAAAILGTLCAVTYIQNCLAHKQADLVIAALLLGGCWLLTQARPLAAATCLGLSAAAKCTPLLFVPYLVWRRRPVTAAWLLAVAVGVNLLPDLVHPAPGGRPWLALYVQRFLAPLTAGDHYVGTWGSEPVYNQSLSGAVNRWFLTTPAWDQPDCPVLPRGTAPSPLLLRALAYGPALALLLATLWAAAGPWQRAEQLPGTGRVGLECSAVLLLMLLLSPMSSKAHFGTLILPGYCLARAAARARRPLAWVPVGAAVLLALLSTKDPLGERLYTVSLWFGSVTLETLLLLGWCLVLLRTSRRAGADAMVKWDEHCPAPAHAA
jgi:hypothetical protein